jgi:hypothetical protein
MLHGTRPHKVNPADAIYNLIYGLDVLNRCIFYKELLNDIINLKLTMALKIEAGIKNNFDLECVDKVLRNTADEVHNGIKNIYLDLKIKAKLEGRPFFIPLPDYSSQTSDEKYSKNEQSTCLAIQKNKDETIELIKTDTSLIIALIKELKVEDTRPDYIKKLIDEFYLYEDGKKVQKSLNETVAKLVEITGQFVTWEYIKNTFIQSDGKQYSDAACKAARDLANT